MELIERHKCFGGSQAVWEHDSDVLGCKMRFGIFHPGTPVEPMYREVGGQSEKRTRSRRAEPPADLGPCPVLYFLSGLTCTEQNFITKGGAQRYASEHGVIIVAPDTSPRGDHVPDADGYDLGKGAGFYVNATQEPWAANYQMADYVTEELPALIDDEFVNSGRSSIMGHSMGGHGALVLALRNPGKYASVSAIAPIVAPSQVPWGQKAFTAYLGEDPEAWKEWDACELVARATERLPMLVDQGNEDEFRGTQLMPKALLRTCKAHEHPLELRFHKGYDHSYYFISSVIEDHIAHHAAALR